MYEHNYCQHNALKPADFKWNCCPTLPRSLAGPCSVDRTYSRVGWCIKCCTLSLWPHTPQPQAPSRWPQIQFGNFLTGFKKKKKKNTSLNHPYVGAKCKKKKKKSNQHKVGRESQSRSLSWLASLGRLWHSLFTSAHHWVFAVSCNSCRPFVALCKAKGRAVVYSPM